MEITQPIFEPQRVLERIEAALARALEEDTERLLRACREFLLLYSSPTPVFYDPHGFFSEHKAEIVAGRHELRLEPVSECTGIPERLLTCLHGIIHSTRLEEDAALFLEVFEQEERREKIPRIGLGLDGPGYLPNDFFLDGVFRLPFEELNDCWTLATRGGRIDRMPNGLDLRLKGMRLTPAPLPEADTLLALLEKASTREDIPPILKHLEGNPGVEACDLRILLHEVLQERKEAFNRVSLTLETHIAPEIPPILVRRARIKAFFANLCEFALWTVSAEGGISLAMEYDAASRALVLRFTLSTPRADVPSVHFPLLRRITEQQGGLLDITVHPAQPPARKKSEATIHALFPDQAGAELDAWIPGWEAFSPKARQMLRLVKSGASPLPEEFILGGILEDELERWLMPRLSTPLAQNLAHELKTVQAELPGAALERLKKAMAPIMRGKPKKEFCGPAYAGELFWHFRQSARARKALGTERLTEDMLKKFSEGLLASPPLCPFCLKTLAALMRDDNP